MSSTEGVFAGGTGYSATVKKRSLGKKLVELREARGLKFTAVSRDAHVPPNTLAGLERGRWVRPMTDHVRALCELYGVSEQEQAELLQVTFEARTPGWWRAKAYRGIFSHELPGFEAGASMIRTFESQLIPGLLQAPGYVELVTRASVAEDQDVDRYVSARLKRQEVLRRPEHPVGFHAIIDGAAILRVPRQVKAEQVRHLLDAAALPNVTIQVVPVDAGVYAGMGEPFTHMTFEDAEARDLVFLETTIDDRYLERDEEVAAYSKRFEQLSGSALDPEQTRDFLGEQKIG